MEELVMHLRLHSTLFPIALATLTGALMCSLFTLVLYSTGAFAG